MIRRANQPKQQGAPPADLLVCFPSRAHLTLMPKQIRSPARLRQLKKLPSTRLGSGLGPQARSPSSWDKDKREASEPSSPKVTCAGQIKVRHRSAAGGSCKSWQSVMEELERIHKKNKNEKKRASWGDALGIKKEVMQFLTCLRNIKLDFRCFGAMPECDLTSDDDEEDEEEEIVNHNKNMNQKSDNKEEINESGKSSRTVFSNWFMVLEENQDVAETENEPEAPPPNALLLMRCRSAPAKSWLENRRKVVVEDEEEDKEAGKEKEKDVEEEKIEEKQRKKLRDYLVVMEYDTELYKLSNDVAKETWVVGSVNPFSRSRSWKR
ncbi:unnamed protein product [Rhodiola kirilowii]